MIRNAALAEYAQALKDAGFTVHAPGGRWEFLKYSRVVNGVVCGGTVHRAEGLATTWEHLMPIRPSREDGSSMFVDGVPVTAELMVADAERVAVPFNSNPVVGRRANHVGDDWAVRYAEV